MVLATQDETRDPASLVRLLTEHEVDIMQATPATWRMLIDWGWEGKSDLLVLCAEVFATAGPPELARSLIAKLLDAIGGYGLSGLSAQALVLAASVARDADEQARYAGQALEKFTNLGDTLGRARALVQQGHAALWRGDPEAAIISAQDILEIAQAYQQPDLEAAAELIGGLAVQANAQTDEAKESLERALALAEQHHLIALAVRCLAALGQPQQAEAMARTHGLER